MTPSMLIAVNYVREQRMLIIAFLAWLFGFGILMGFVHRSGSLEDMEFLFRQQSAYGVIMVMLASAGALHSERKTRRIVSVISKGITRGEYLGGIILGNWLLAVVYMAALWLVNLLFAANFGYDAPVGGATLALWICCLLVAAMAVMLSTVMHPGFVLLTLGIVISAWTFLARASGGAWALAFPPSYVLNEIYGLTFQEGWTGSWMFAPIALGEAAVAWRAAAALFSRRDMTIQID